LAASSPARRASFFTTRATSTGDRRPACTAQYYANRRHFGDPAYGSWPDHAQQPIRDKVQATLRGESQAAPAASAASQTVVTSLAYQMVARAEKARVMACLLHQAGLSAIDVERMTSSMWRAFHGGLRAAGILGKSSTEPSADTIARTLAELRKLERIIPVVGAALVSRRSEAA
jgi:hypothetical protein